MAKSIPQGRNRIGWLTRPKTNDAGLASREDVPASLSELVSPDAESLAHGAHEL